MAVFGPLHRFAYCLTMVGTPYEAHALTRNRPDGPIYLLTCLCFFAILYVLPIVVAYLFGAPFMPRKRVVESFRDAADAIGPIEHEMSVFAITRGQFSMIDAILHTLKQLGTAQISCWTWAIADYEVEAMVGLMARKEITGGRLIIDASADRRDPAIINKWRDRFGDEEVRICKNHAKIARVWNDEYSVLLRGSMNLNMNPRFEQLDVTEGGEDFQLVKRIEDEMPILKRKYANAEADHASGLGKAFEQSTLTFFQGLKTWAK